MPRIGIISEGRPDQAVLENIIHYYTKDQDYDIILIRPDLTIDSTDRILRDTAAAGGFARIKKDCEERTLLEEFFALDFEEKDVILIHLDTAEVDDFGIIRPSRNSKNYSIELRNNVIEKINNVWLANYDEKLIFAISIEEIEAWVLTLFENRNSTQSIDPKRRLQRLLDRANTSTAESYSNYESISKRFLKKRFHEVALTRNKSLAIFCEELKLYLIDQVRSIAEIVKILENNGITIEPLNEEELGEVEELNNEPLPLVYKEFLRHMGKGAGSFMSGSDVFFDKIPELNSWANELLAENDLPALPPNAFVFWMHQGYQAAYFLLGESDNPTVYYYSEVRELQNFISEGSLLDFFKIQLKLIISQ